MRSMGENFAEKMQSRRRHARMRKHAHVRAVHAHSHSDTHESSHNHSHRHALARTSKEIVGSRVMHLLAVLDKGMIGSCALPFGSLCKHSARAKY
jgi:hypothetical protein